MNYALGLVLVIVAAQFQAGFPLPMKYARKWNWEIIWSVYCVIGLMLLPWLAGLIRIPNMVGVLASCTGRELAVPIAFGLLWGVALTLYGLGLALLGLSLGNSIMSALGPTVGSLVPLIVLHREKVFAREGISIYIGIIIIFFGIYFVGKAGQARDMKKAGLAATSGSRRYGLGLLYIIISGILAPSATLALAFGTPIIQRGVHMGVPATEATFLIWILFFPIGSLLSLLYCFWLMRKNRSWKQFSSPGTGNHWLLVLAMSTLGLVSILMYGVSTVYLGPLGVPIAQALYVIFTILGANALGFLIGEWRGVTGAPFRSLVVGIVLLVLACAVIAAGNR